MTSPARPDAPAGSALRRALAVLVVVVLVLLSAMGMVSALSAQREQVAQVELTGGPLPLVAAVIANVAGNALLVGAWRAVLRTGGIRIGRRAAAFVWCASQLARYAVGAAQVAGRAALGRRYGVPATAGGLTTLVEIGWSISIIGLIVLASLPGWGGATDRSVVLAAALPVLALAVIVIAPESPLRLVRAALRRLPARFGRIRRLADVGEVALDRRSALRITGLYGLNAGARVVGFLAVAVALGADAPVALLVGAFAAGQLVGFLVVFAPGGLGFREGTAVLLLAPSIGPGRAVALVALARIVEIVAEVLSMAGAAILRPPVPATDNDR